VDDVSRDFYLLDIGGGLAKDTEEHALSNISLRWMVSEIMKAQCDILFDETALDLWNIPIAAIKLAHVPMTLEVTDSTLRDEESEIGLGKDTPDKYQASLARDANASTGTLTPGHNGAGALSPFTPAEESPDTMDAAQKIGNAFKKNVFWWVLEVIPTFHEWQNEQDVWVGKWR
jgi:hypothetical protein